ncbi:MAG: hypothetical protein WD361_03180, partial [Gracilimonas sp.]
TSYQVWRELDPEEQEILNSWVQSGQLTVIKIDEDFVSELQDRGFSKSLSIPDQSAWYLCEVQGGILLTSDGTLRKTAKRFNIKTHGLLWIFDQIVTHKILPTAEAESKLNIIFEQNLYYRSNKGLYETFKKLLNKWQ